MLEADISETFRVKKLDKDKRPQNGPIIVKFKTREKKLACYMNRKKLAGQNFKEIGIDAEKIFINENLCFSTRQLFYLTNIQRKKLGWERIWTQEGIIKVKKTRESPILTINDDNDLKLKIK